MRFEHKLIPAKIIERKNRFVIEAMLSDNEIVFAHCPNSGTLDTCYETGCEIFLSESDNPKRKLKYTWEISRLGNTMIFVNTIRTNRVVIEAIKNGIIPELFGYESIKPEPVFGDNSRFDVLLENQLNNREKCYVEVKNATLFHDKKIKFPDAKTKRGQKHLNLLKKAKMEGHRAVIFFHIARTDGDFFSPADHIDPLYAKLLRDAVDSGVEALAYRSKISSCDVSIFEKIPTIL
jgi:sugar fermentation stimulation protein A